LNFHAEQASGEAKTYSKLVHCWTKVPCETSLRWG